MFTRPEEEITFIQAETEVAAFNMIAGAVAAGHRAMTATSGPGFSLSQEAMSFMSCADQTVGWHHRLDGQEFEQVPGAGNGQGSLACYSPWDHKESDTTE